MKLTDYALRSDWYFPAMPSRQQVAIEAADALGLAITRKGSKWSVPGYTGTLSGIMKHLNALLAAAIAANVPQDSSFFAEPVNDYEPVTDPSASETSPCAPPAPAAASSPDERT